MGIETAINVLALTFARGYVAGNTNDDLVKILMEQFPGTCGWVESSFQLHLSRCRFEELSIQFQTASLSLSLSLILD